MGKMSARSIYDWTIGGVVKIWKSGKWGKALIVSCGVICVAIVAYFQIMESFRVEFPSDVRRSYEHAIRENNTRQASKYVLDVGSLKNLGAIRQLVGSERYDSMLKANRHYLDACNKYLLDARNKKKQTGCLYRFGTSAPSERIRPSKQLRDLGWGCVSRSAFSIESVKRRGSDVDTESVDTAELFLVEFEGRWKIIR